MTTAAVTAGLALGLTACSTGDTTEPAADDTTATAKPHGYVEGASEAQEPQVRLLAVSATGATTVHDLLSGGTTALDDVDGRALRDRREVPRQQHAGPHHDRRRRFVDRRPRRPHAYYAAEPRVVGSIDGGGPVEVHSSETMTTITWPERGEGVVLDRAALGQGDVEETARIDATVLLPFGKQLVAGTADGVRVLDADGESTGTEAACPDPAGGIVHPCRCRGRLRGRRGRGQRDRRHHRCRTARRSRAADGVLRPSGRPTVAGLAGDRGAWLLDSREGSWRLVETERPLRAVTAVDDEDEHVVGIDDQGRVVVMTASTGAVATTDALLDPDEQPLLQLDAQRAYVADASGQQVHEIDFADGARVARSIDLPAAPVAFAEVGL